LHALTNYLRRTEIELEVNGRGEMEKRLIGPEIGLRV